MNPVRILLVDDHQLVRAGIKALLESVADFQLVGEAADGAEMLRQVETLAPDMVLMDVAMPILFGLQALERLRADDTVTRVIMLSMYASEEHIIRALELGACGYVVKDAAPGELESAIRAALRDEIWLPSRLPIDAINHYLKRTKLRRSDTLSPRQKEVLKLIADGVSTRDIAERLNLSVKTVESHRAQILARLNIQDVPGLVRYAILHGLSDL